MPDLPPIVTDSQVAALGAVIAGGLAAIAAAIRWVGKQWSIGQRETNRALIANAEMSATLATKIDGVAAQMGNILQIALGVGTDSTPTSIPKPRMSTDSQRRRSGPVAMRRPPSEDETE